MGVLGLLAAALAGCGAAAPDWLGRSYPAVHYKLAIEVETPSGIRRATNVISVSRSVGGTMFGSQASGSHAVDGEALIVDLPDGQQLFVLLRGPDMQDWPASLSSNILVGSGSSLPGESRFAAPDRYQAALSRSRGAFPIRRRFERVSRERDNYPYFVRMTQKADPETFEPVDPDALEKSFGPGYRLRSFTVEVTDEAVGRTAVEKLGPSFFDKWQDANARLSECHVDHPYFRRFFTRLSMRDLVRRDALFTAPAELRSNDAGLQKWRSIPCEQRIPGYSGGPLRRWGRPPVFSHADAEAEADPTAMKLARWTPGSVELTSNWRGKLVRFNGCLAFERHGSPMLIVFPFGEGRWDEQTRTLRYGNEKVAVGNSLSLQGEIIHLFVDGGKADIQSDTPDIGPHEFHRCNGFELFVVKPLENMALIEQSTRGRPGRPEDRMSVAGR
jgi:hypothetical protein